MFSLLEIALLVIMVFICVYALIDRICKCIENTSLARMFRNMPVKPEDIIEIFNTKTKS